MSDQSMLQTEPLNLPALDSVPTSQETAEDDPLRHREDQRIIALQQAEIAQLTQAIAELRKGHRVSVVIDGNIIPVHVEGVVELVAPASNGNGHHKKTHGANGLDDSFVL
jgi:hypothetical protein